MEKRFTIGHQSSHLHCLGFVALHHLTHGLLVAAIVWDLGQCGNDSTPIAESDVGASRASGIAPADSIFALIRCNTPISPSQ